MTKWDFKDTKYDKPLKYFDDIYCIYIYKIY